MKLFRSLTQLDDTWRGGAVAIGNFDGVHQGHARIVERLIHHAQRVGGPSIVFTFDPHPAQLLRPDQAPPALVWTDRKAELLQRLGVEAMVAYPTDNALLSLEPLAFFEQIVHRDLGARAIVEGPNFYFGRNRAGDVALLKQLCDEHQMRLEIVPPVDFEESTISSSRIRKLIMEGNLERAGAMLTDPYRMRGMVAHGAARGRRLGFPTANLENVDTLVPALGVYAGWSYPAGKAVAAAIHIGPNPTFAEAHPKLEVHLIDYEGNLYGQRLEVDFLARLRDIQKFPDVDTLRRQLQHDVQAARRVCEASSSPNPPALSP